MCTKMKRALSLDREHGESKEMLVDLDIFVESTSIFRYLQSLFISSLYRFGQSFRLKIMV